MNYEFISIKGAKVNNLKNIDVNIPRNKLVVITGLSGSGKSSLAFDTLYAEGQRRYVESLSSYARQFMGKLSKPEVEFIKGIPPAIAIEQKVISRNPRSTIGTTTEIYEYLKLLFSRIGKTYSPINGKEVKREDIKDVVEYIKSAPENGKVYILSPFTITSDRTPIEQLKILKMQGFSRVVFNKELFEIDDFIDTKKSIIGIKQNQAKTFKNLFILIDRFKASATIEHPQRMHDSIQTAFFEGKGTCVIQIENGDIKQREFSNLFSIDGIIFEEPTPHMFSFNNPFGACPTCSGTGIVEGFAVNKVIPDLTKSVFEDGVECWNIPTLKKVKDDFIKKSVHLGFPLHRAIIDLTNDEFLLLWEGDPAKKIIGILQSLEDLSTNHDHPLMRILVSKYKGSTYCPDCKGSRLKKGASYVKIGGYSITEMVNVPLHELYTFFKNFKYKNDTERVIAQKLVQELTTRIGFINDVGLGYLTLNRNSRTLSGGESQRINLATSLGSSLVGSLYVLDEPSIGLHPRDTENLIRVLHRLRDIGNSVVVVEHDEEIIKSADYIIDIGPLAGRLGGEVVFNGSFGELIKDSDNLTAKYLRGMLSNPKSDALSSLETMQIAVPKIRRKWRNYIEVKDAFSNNLKKVTVKFPMDILTVVTGVSGSGKSTLVRNELYEKLNQYISSFSFSYKSQYTGLKITKTDDLQVVMVDQNPIGKSSRSNPATYLKIFDDIRELFAQQPLSLQRNYKPSFFSFNREGGRCDACEGEGVIHIEMQFMADVELLCTECNGKRYKEEVLDVKFHNVSISDILDMTINQTFEFFSSLPQTKLIESIIFKLKPLREVGLGYLKMGQASSTLSGGEAQRIKLAFYLCHGNSKKNHVFIFDEPTTGLHFHDINSLYHAFNKLIEIGNTVIVIEHNPELIKCADWIIDLGPDGGEKGGEILFEGTPEDLIKCKNSHTGKYLKPKLK